MAGLALETGKRPNRKSKKSPRSCGCILTCRRSVGRSKPRRRIGRRPFALPERRPTMIKTAKKAAETHRSPRRQTPSGSFLAGVRAGRPPTSEAKAWQIGAVISRLDAGAAGCLAAERFKEATGARWSSQPGRSGGVCIGGIAEDSGRRKAPRPPNSIPPDSTVEPSALMIRESLEMIRGYSNLDSADFCAQPNGSKAGAQPGRQRPQFSPPSRRLSGSARPLMWKRLFAPLPVTLFDPPPGLRRSIFKARGKKRNPTRPCLRRKRVP